MVLVELYFNTLGKLIHSTEKVGVCFLLCILTVLSQLHKLRSIIALSDTVTLKDKFCRMCKEMTVTYLK